MYRRFIATITAASIALTTVGAMPAAAGERDTARAIAAILGVAVIGSIIHENSKKKKQVQHHTPAPVYQQPQRRKAAPVYQAPRAKKKSSRGRYRAG